MQYESVYEVYEGVGWRSGAYIVGFAMRIDVAKLVIVMADGRQEMLMSAKIARRLGFGFWLIWGGIQINADARPSFFVYLRNVAVFTLSSSIISRQPPRITMIISINVNAFNRRLLC